jgi:hypothetical protein
MMHKCFGTDCDRPVVYSFQWGWGDQAHCCEAHRVEAQQIHNAQERGMLTFTPLDPHQVAPLHRDERTLLIAGRLSAEEDTRQVQVRAAELHNDVVALKDETRRLLARNVSLEDKLGTVTGERDRAIGERDNTLATLHETTEELRRVRLLIPRVSAPVG